MTTQHQQVPASPLYDLAQREIIVRSTTLVRNSGIRTSDVILIIRPNGSEPDRPYACLSSASDGLRYNALSTLGFEREVGIGQHFWSDYRREVETKAVVCRRVEPQIDSSRLVDPHALPVLVRLSEARTEIQVELRRCRANNGTIGIDLEVIEAFYRRFNTLVENLIADCNKFTGLDW